MGLEFNPFAFKTEALKFFFSGTPLFRSQKMFTHDQFSRFTYWVVLKLWVNFCLFNILYLTLSLLYMFPLVVCTPLFEKHSTNNSIRKYVHLLSCERQLPANRKLEGLAEPEKPGNSLSLSKGNKINLPAPLKLTDKHILSNCKNYTVPGVRLKILTAVWRVWFLLISNL